MKVVLCCIVLSVVLVCGKPQEGTYTNKYDNFDLDSVLNNRRLLENYVNCALDKGKCTKEAAELKTHIPEALTTDCAKCTDKQREAAKKVLKHLIEKERSFFDALEKKYDPEGIYKKKYEEEAKKEGISL